MKRVLLLLCATLLLCFILSGCGNSLNAKTHKVDSNLYSQWEISSAINTIKREFMFNWSGCSLTEIYYAGDDTVKNYQDWADRNNADEVIVLTSAFNVDSSGGDGSLNPNSTYKNWKWILVRTNNGKWTHVDHGY